MKRNNCINNYNNRMFKKMMNFKKMINSINKIK